MATITAEQVKELRETTGAGMMECKRALQEANGDMNAAIDIMRKSGIAKAAKKSDRTAAEGIIVIKLSNDKKRGVIVEVNCETDFVARDSNFVNFAENVANQALNNEVQQVDALLELPYQAGSANNIETARKELIAKIGENVQVRRLALVEASGILGAYKHGERIGALVQLDVDNSELGKEIAMHIVASNPQAVHPSDVSPDMIAQERQIFVEQAQTSGKPQEIIDKMIAGRMQKFLNEVSLVGQPFVKDPEKTVGQLLEAAKANVLGFVRYQVGEGIEKKCSDFASEVMAQVRGGN